MSESWHSWLFGEWGMKRKVTQENKPEKKEIGPRLFSFEGDKTKPLIAIALKDPGPRNSLVPVILELQKRQYPIVVVASGWVSEHASELPEGFNEQPHLEFLEAKPQIVIRTVADLRRGGEHALPEEHEKEWDDATYLDFEDYPGNARRIVSGGRRSPDYLLVLNEQARVDDIEIYPNINPQNILTIGNPAFDRYAQEGGEIKREETRRQLGVEDDEMLVVVSGQLPPVATYVAERVVSALNIAKTSKKIVLLYAHHPRLLNDQERYGEDLDAINASILGFKGRIIERPDSVIGSADNIGYAADLLVSSHSTEGIASMYRGVPALYVGIPKNGKFSDDHKEAYPHGKKPLPVEVGAAFWIDGDSSIEEAGGILKEATEDSKKRNENVLRGREEFLADGKATRRFVDVIESISFQ